MGSLVRRLTERLTVARGGALAPDSVDAENGILKGVVLCGFESANGRKYPQKVLAAAAAKYEGAKANLNHNQGGSTFQTWVGVVRNVSVGGDGRPRGDVHLFLSDQHTPKVIEAAQKAPDKFGMSHVAMCRTRREGGVEVVEDIEAVESVDIVVDPATVPGLFESKGGRAVVKLREWVAGFARHPKATTAQILAVKRLAEMDGMGDLPVSDPPAMTDESPDADDAVMAAFKAAIGSVVDQAMSGEMDPKEALGKIKTLLKSHGELNSDGTPDTDDDPETGAGEEAAESRRSAAGLIREAVNVCRKVGFKGFDADDLDMILSVPTDRREAVARRLMGTARPDAGGERPESGGRHQFAEHKDEADAANRVRESLGGKGVGGKDADLPWLG
jgi:hypothetical protein